MMQCTDINELMMDFIYRELEVTREDEFRAHVASCSRCGAELASLERTRSALRELPDAEPPAAVTARLLHEAAKRMPRASEEQHGGILSWLAGLFRPVMAHPGWAAAASLVVLVGVVFLQRSGKLSSKSQENPGVVAQRSEESAKDGKAAEAQPMEPSSGATGATGAAAPAGAADNGAAPVVATSPPAATIQLDGYSDSNVTMDGKGEKVGGRLGVEGGEHTVRLQEVTPEPSPKGTPGKKMAGPGGGGGLADPFDYRAAPKTDEIARTGVLMQDKGVAVPGVVVSESTTEGQRNRTAGADTTKAKPADAVTKVDADKSRMKAKDAPAKETDFYQEAAAEDESDDAEIQAPVKAPQGGAGAPAPRKPATDPAAGRAVNETRATASPAPAPAAPPPEQPARTNNVPAQNQRRDVAKAETNTGTTSAGGGAGGNVAGNVARGGQEHKAEPKLDTTAAKLHIQARQAAKTGNCSVALETRRKIQRIDNDYYKRNVAKDAVFSECDTKQRSMEKKSKKPAPAAPREEMEAPATDRPASNE